MAVGEKIQRNLGSANIVKGNNQGMEFASLDLVDKCDGDDCPISHVCKYPKKDKPCGIQIEYLGIVAQKTLSCIRKKNESDVIRVGMFMMPMYLHLVKLKMFEYGSSVVGKKSGKMNPVFKETRETIKALDTMLSKLGNDGRGIGGKGKNTDPDDAGDPNFYDTLFESNPDEKPPKQTFSRVKSKRRRVRNNAKGNTNTGEGSMDSVL